MLFSQMEKIKNIAKLFSFCLFVFIVAGCFAQKTENVQIIKQVQLKTLDKIAVIPNGRQISAVSVDLKDQILEIEIQGNQKLNNYSSIKQAFPFGIAIYFPDTTIAHNLKTSLPENQIVGGLVVKYADEEKTMVKIEILLKEDLTYKVIENVKSVMFESMKTDETAFESMKTDETATMTSIEFNTMEDGKSDIVVQTNHPVKYDITQHSNDKLCLNLYNTIIPSYHKRPLLTQYFKSAVESLIPIQVPGEKRNSTIEIKIRQQVPYRIVQVQNTISIFFEPSTIAPPVFAKATKKVQIQTIVAGKEKTDLSEGTKVVANKKTALEEEIFGKTKKYTGEKIKLDFYETDIKNVFRIFRSVGRLNLAIDKDVDGKVTLAFEDPVPWDQVMDLVLKMNNLGMKKEGNIIRIATLNTLKKEEQLLQDTITTKKKSLEQKKSLEPLVTEYIPINYSDGKVDIKPHIDQILTNRGKMTVDKRTNMLIITDVQEKIDQAREIIFRLDKVTPQIMIEAKVIEVSKNFSRELGLGLSLSRAQTASVANKNIDFEIALNHPLTATSNAGSLNFYRILGSNFLSLNAQIAASEVKGDVKIISSPRILTLDNKKAKIKQGLEYAYLERDNAGGSSVKFKSIDLLLEVTPHVTPDKRISLKILLTKNDIDSITDGVPSLSTNEAETELLVNNNDTIVIGGIVKTSTTDSSTGTPIFSGIPILGRLFRTEIDHDKRNELLIFITPSIVQLEQKRNIITTAD